MDPRYGELVMQSPVFDRFCIFILLLQVLQKYFFVTIGQSRKEQQITYIART